MNGLGCVAVKLYLGAGPSLVWRSWFAHLGYDEFLLCAIKENQIELGVLTEMSIKSFKYIHVYFFRGREQNCIHPQGHTPNC